MRSLILAFLSLAFVLSALAPGAAHWTGPTDPALHAWFDQLASGKGLCCSFADGVSIEDVDWGTTAVNTDCHGHVVDQAAPCDESRYWVKLNGQTIIVPPEAVVTEPNKYGRAVVWPYQDADGKTQIRCFMPGAQS